MSDHLPSPSMHVPSHNSSLSKFCNPKFLNILYFNARSLLPKFTELQLIAMAYLPSVICITESWVCSDIMDSEISIQGYQVVCLDRNRNGGCVLMYVSVDLHFSVLFNPDKLELLTIVVSHESGKACISLFYRPPSSPSYIFDTLYLSRVPVSASIL